MNNNHVLITGGTGLIGQYLTHLLTRMNYKVRYLSRSPQKSTQVDAYYWDPQKKELDESALDGIGHVIHLAGANLSKRRWSKSRKKLIYNSRVDATQFLIEKIANHKSRPKSFLGMSAVGIYGNSGKQWVDEHAGQGSGFLPKVCEDWESKTKKASGLGIRTVIYRSGVVLSNEDGMLPKLMDPLKFGIAPVMGSGKQYLSWVHIEDIARSLIYAIENPNMNGTYNIVAPYPVTQKELMNQLVQKIHFGIQIPVPALALRIGLGEMANTVLEGQRVSSQKLRLEGFQFKYPQLEEALDDLKHHSGTE
jgi:hypothetical protein